MTYAYSCQVHRSTNVTPFSLTLTREHSSPSDINSTSAVQSDANKTKSAQLLKQRILERLRTMKIMTNSSADVAEERYKKHFDKSVHVECKYSSGGYDFVDVPVEHTL